MTQTVSLPLWLVVIAGLLALWALIARLLVPGVRWYFRRRANRLIDELNTRLDLKIPPIALTKRHVMIDRLVYDPKVIEEVSQFCEAEGVPRDVAVARVQRYAREVAPAFNAYVYFRVGHWINKRLAERLYRVRLGYADQEALANLDPKASVVFVINHRSNMDYVLVTYLVLQRTALSYAVGEWARVWPLQQLIRALGAYFVRRDSGNPLYRRVLERYVQIAVEGGVTQAVFPEGGLSRDGLMREPRIGLLDYMLRTFDPDGERDIIFIPVALNYDRVLEDRTLLADGDPDAERRSGLTTVKVMFKILARGIKLRLSGQLYRFGYACANFGAPISMRAYTRTHDWNPRRDSKAERIPKVFELAEHLTAEIGKLIPVLPVSLLAAVMLREPEAWLSEEDLKLRSRALKDNLAKGGAIIYVPREDRDYFVTVGLRMLTLRRLVDEQNGRYRVNPSETRLLRYYANAIAHLTRAEP